MWGVDQRGGAIWNEGANSNHYGKHTNVMAV